MLRLTVSFRFGWFDNLAELKEVGARRSVERF